MSKQIRYLFLCLAFTMVSSVQAGEDETKVVPGEIAISPFDVLAMEVCKDKASRGLVDVGTNDGPATPEDISTARVAIEFWYGTSGTLYASAQVQCFVPIGICCNEFHSRTEIRKVAFPTRFGRVVHDPDSHTVTILMYPMMPGDPLDGRLDSKIKRVQIFYKKVTDIGWFERTFALDRYRVSGSLWGEAAELCRWNEEVRAEAPRTDWFAEE